jgi:hypothetical protein
MTSAINPNNIDGSYPVAGQDNNSQGFRDNFTNIKVNFQDAAAEITDLQNKALLKSALSGATLDNNMGNTLIYAAQVQAFSAVKNIVSGTSGSLVVNYQSGHYQTITPTDSISLSFTGWPATGSYGYLKLQIVITDPAYTVTLPAAVSLGTSGLQGYSAGTITFAAAGTYEFGFGSYNNGTTITIFDLNRALTNFTSATYTTLSVTGNVTGGNVLTSGLISSSGNITGGNVLNSGIISSTGNSTAANYSTGGLISATGNVTGAYLNGFGRPTVGTASQSPVLFSAGTNLSVATGGAQEYDGAVAYFTPSSNRGVLGAQHFITLTSDYTASDVATAQQVFNSTTSGAIALSATKTYLFDAVYYITRSAGATSRTLSVLFNTSNALSSISYIAETTSTASNILGTVSRIYGTATTATVVTAASTDTNQNITVVLRGMIRTSTATTFTPQIQFSAIAGGAPSVLSGSYFRLVSLGTSSVTSVGNWS